MTHVFTETDFNFAPEPALEVAYQFKSGGQFVLDDPAGIDAIWGSGEDVLWSAGEGLLITGPTGVGKTTLALQLLAGRLGIIDRVLGWPVAASEEPVLYLAMDRPRQIRRAMARIFGEEHREVLEKKLIVWEGPLPFDLGRVPESLLDLAKASGARTVFNDSLKDAAVKLSDDEVGGNLNRAIQLLVRDGFEVNSLHHHRKQGKDTAKPKNLDDIYGSVWIPAGQGSVISLWGKAGDPIVEMSHLKQPAAEVGPLKIAHDHNTGLSEIWRGQVDPLKVLRNAPNGITTVDLARLMFECDKPNDNQRKKAQRHLDRLVLDDLARKVEEVHNTSGGAVPARYVAAALL